MSMKDVRDFLTKQLAELADSDLKGEELSAALERARATSLVASTYVSTVKTELDAIRVLDDTGKLASAIEAPSMETHDARVLSFEGRRA